MEVKHFYENNFWSLQSGEGFCVNLSTNTRKFLEISS